MMDFTRRNRRLLVYQVDEEWYAFGPPAFQAEMADRFSGRAGAEEPQGHSDLSGKARSA